MSTVFNKEQVMQANQQGADAMFALADVAFKSAERLAALNMNVARSLLEEGVGNTRALMGAKDLQELVKLEASLVQPAMEKMLGYTQSCCEIAMQAQDEFTKVLEAQTGSVNKQLTEGMAQMNKMFAAGVPGVGSFVSPEAFTSSLQNFTGTSNPFTQAFQQLTEMAQANMAALSNATLKSVQEGVKNVAANSKKAR